MYLIIGGSDRLIGLFLAFFFGGNSFFLIVNIFSFMKIIIGGKDEIYSLVYIVLDYIEDEETGFKKTLVFPSS